MRSSFVQLAAHHIQHHSDDQHVCHRVHDSQGCTLARSSSGAAKDLHSQAIDWHAQHSLTNHGGKEKLQSAEEFMTRRVTACCNTG